MYFLIKKWPRINLLILSWSNRPICYLLLFWNSYRCFCIAQCRKLLGSSILFVQSLEIRKIFNTKWSKACATIGNRNAVAQYEKMKEWRDRVDFMWRLRAGVDNGLAMKPFVSLLPLRNQAENTTIICSYPFSK